MPRPAPHASASYRRAAARDAGCRSPRHLAAHVTKQGDINVTYPPSSAAGGYPARSGRDAEYLPPFTAEGTAPGDDRDTGSDIDDYEGRGHRSSRRRGPLRRLLRRHDEQPEPGFAEPEFAEPDGEASGAGPAGSMGPAGPAGTAREGGGEPAYPDPAWRSAGSPGAQAPDDAEEPNGRALPPYRAQHRARPAAELSHSWRPAAGPEDPRGPHEAGAGRGDSDQAAREHLSALTPDQEAEGGWRGPGSWGDERLATRTEFPGSPAGGPLTGGAANMGNGSADNGRLVAAGSRTGSGPPGPAGPAGAAGPGSAIPGGAAPGPPFEGPPFQGAPFQGAPPTPGGHMAPGAPLAHGAGGPEHGLAGTVGSYPAAAGTAGAPGPAETTSPSLPGPGTPHAAPAGPDPFYGVLGGLAMRDLTLVESLLQVVEKLESNEEDPDQ